MTDFSLDDQRTGGLAQGLGEDDAPVWPTLLFLAVSVLMTAGLLVGVA